MSEYYFARTFDSTVEDAIERVTNTLKSSGFGVLTTIDVQATMKKKLDVDMPPYVILGACNPNFAWQALQAEEMIGTMLPCNVIVKARENGETVVAAVDPIASMQSIENEQLGAVAAEVRSMLKNVIETM